MTLVFFTRELRGGCLLLALATSAIACAAADDEDAADASVKDASIVHSSQGDPIGPWMTFAERPCPSDSALTRDNFGGAFLTTYCTGCHGSDRMNEDRMDAPYEVVFGDPEPTRELANLLWQVAADTHTFMPPKGGPTLDERRQFGEWLACGAP